MVLEAIKYSSQDATLLVLDQLRLPYETHFDRVSSCEQAHAAIKQMRVRGAPAIAMVAVLALAVELRNANTSTNATDAAATKRHIAARLDYLITSRPTAVNLADAARKLKAAVSAVDNSLGPAAVVDVCVETAEEMLREDVLTNKAIGAWGARWIAAKTEAGGPVSILTHCNTGSLATAGYGTALGVIRAVHESGALLRAYCTETRPYNQGSRLTAFELVHDQIPATLVTDSMASALLRLKGGSDNIAAVVVGADRVAANGDTANKIGTYALAITAKYHGVKFLVAAPRTTIDLGTASGQEIVIEERAAQEMTTVRGPPVGPDGVVDSKSGAHTVSTAADGIQVWNPAFDVTPCELIDGIVTEVGVAEKDATGRFRLAEIMSAGAGQGAAKVNGAAHS